VVDEPILRKASLNDIAGFQFFFYHQTGDQVFHRISRTPFQLSPPARSLTVSGAQKFRGGDCMG
jgi:hypothetical protein